MVVFLTAASFKPLCLPPVASSCPMLRTYTFSWFCMTAACCLHNVIIMFCHAPWNVESHTQSADRCVPGKATDCADNLVLQTLQSAAKSQTVQVALRLAVIQLTLASSDIVINLSEYDLESVYN